MQLIELLHKTFQKELPLIHKTRFQNVMDACETAVRGHKLYLTGLGRELINKNTTKSNIQKMDRLLGNKQLQEELQDFYGVMSEYLLKCNPKPFLHVDWSCINAVTNLYVLRASLSVKGRSIAIYEECHPKKNENNHATHTAFLNRLKALLSPGVKPIIVTDAGFRGPWFSLVLRLGWDFVGRLRNKNLVLLDGCADWQLSADFFPFATVEPTYLGRGILTRKQKVPAHFVLYKGANKNRHKLNQNKKISAAGKSKRYSGASKEPWVLVTSLAQNLEIAKQAVNIYRQRMRIEENIRDTKCPHYGLGLKKSLSRSEERMSVLLLIAALATFAAWLAGLCVTHQGKAANFQAHSAKFTSALSKVFLGREVLKRGLVINIKQFHLALDKLLQLSVQTQLEVYS